MLNRLFTLNYLFKNKIFYIFSLSCLLLSCSSNEDEVEPEPKYLYPKTGSITIYYKETKTELKEILMSYYLNPQQDTLGILYMGFKNKKYLMTDNSVFLFITRNGELDRVEFNYSPSGTIYSTLFYNNVDNNIETQIPFEHNISHHGQMVKGDFKGKFFSGVDFLTVDSCHFAIEK